MPKRLHDAIHLCNKECTIIITKKKKKQGKYTPKQHSREVLAYFFFLLMQCRDWGFKRGKENYGEDVGKQ